MENKPIFKLAGLALGLGSLWSGSDLARVSQEVAKVALLI